MPVSVTCSACHNLCFAQHCGGRGWPLCDKRGVFDVPQLQVCSTTGGTSGLGVGTRLFRRDLSSTAGKRLVSPLNCKPKVEPQREFPDISGTQMKICGTFANATMKASTALARRPPINFFRLLIGEFQNRISDADTAWEQYNGCKASTTLSHARKLYAPALDR